MQRRSKCSSEYVSAPQLPDDRPIFAPKQRRVRNLIKRYGTTVGKDVHPHAFRLAIHGARNGWDARRLQQVLGHSSLNVTAVYLQFNDAALGHCTIRRRFDVLILRYDTL